MSYRNTARRGMSTTLTVDPAIIVPDINEHIHTLEPYATPLIEISKKIGRGKPPRSKKVQVVNYYSFDPLDMATDCHLGVTGNDETRFARLAVAQISRPGVTQMFYQPQEILYIHETGQSVQVVMTPDAALKRNGSEITLSTALTGNSTTRTNAGYIVVRNVEPDAIASFDTSWFTWMGRTIYESQDIEGGSSFDNMIFDCNFVEHVEDTFEVTEDQMDFIQTTQKMPEWNRNQDNVMKRLKRSVYNKMWFGVRALDTSEPGRPKYFMDGILNRIRTHAMVYNPQTIENMERLFRDWIREQVFRYDNEQNTKFVHGGAMVIDMFQSSFDSMRRIDLSKNNFNVAGLDVTTYVWMGKKLKVMRDEVFRQGTKHEYWAAALDYNELEVRVKRDFDSKPYKLDTWRRLGYMCEWQGTIVPHLEEHHALLRTA